MAALVVFSTVPTRKEGRKLAQLLLKKKLAACVSLAASPVESRYWWKNKIQSGREFLLLIKTTSARFEKLRRAIEQNHSYSVPEILALPVRRGSPKYLAWLRAALKG